MRPLILKLHDGLCYEMCKLCRTELTQVGGGEWCETLTVTPNGKLAGRAPLTARGRVHSGLDGRCSRES